MNPSVSPYLAEIGREEGKNRTFDEVHEVVRVFTVYKANPRVSVRVTIVRYYWPTGIDHSVRYEREDEDGVWREADFGQVLTGSESEEVAITTAVSFIKEAFKIGEFEGYSRGF